MATSGQFYWPLVGSSVAAYGQFGMAASFTALWMERVVEVTVKACGVAVTMLPEKSWAPCSSIDMQ